tara:strand:- start:268 stop:651 length:384 start_codon:yes stop_codon:yes gene_type:complete
MRSTTPFAACVEHLRVSHSELADILTEGSGRLCTPHMASMVAEGRQPVPAFAWSSLRLLDRKIDYFSDQVLQLHGHGGSGRFTISKHDLASPEQARVLVRAMLKLSGGDRVQLVDAPGPTWGMLGAG